MALWLQSFLTSCKSRPTSFSQPESRAPDFVCAGQSGIASIYVVDAPAATMTFFRQIMENEPERFAAMNRIFHHAQSSLQEPAGQSRDLVGSYI